MTDGTYRDRLADVELLANADGFTQVMLDGTVIGWLKRLPERVDHRSFVLRSSGVTYNQFSSSKKDAIDSLVWAAVHDPKRVDWSLHA